MTTFVALSLAGNMLAAAAWAMQRARAERAEAKAAKYRRWARSLASDLSGLPVTYDCPEAER